MERRLKPCPFCGSEAEVIMLSDAGNYGVRCKKCTVVVGEYRFWKRPYAIKVWNTRKPTDKIVEKLSSLFRVVRTDEDCEWNRAIYRASEIVKEEYEND